MRIRNAALVLLALVILCTPLLSAPHTSPKKSEVLSEPILEEMKRSELEIDRRGHHPIDILVYVEYTDITPGPNNEFRNTMNSIDETYGTDYQYQNLTDYTELNETVLSEYDVFLVVEQELSTSEDMYNVSMAWAGFLPDWVAQGGVVISMPFEFTAAHSAQIFNNTGLMGLYESRYISGYGSSVVDKSNALARGVDTQLILPEGTLGFEISDATTVVGFNGTHAVAAHRIYGSGHVVLLAFDNFERYSNADALLANAIRLTRHLVIDDSHLNGWELDTELGNFTDDIVSQGFAVTQMDSFSPELLAACDVLLLQFAQEAYPTDHIDAIEEFVLNGGGLYVATEIGSVGHFFDPVIERFGFVRNDIGMLNDSDDSFNANGFRFVLDGDSVRPHSATLGVGSYYAFGCTVFDVIPERAHPLLVTDEDNSTIMQYSGDTMNGLPISAALTYGDGRVIFTGDMSSLSNDDLDSNGIHDYYQGDNEVFISNCMKWLSAAGIQERIVTWAMSHSQHYSMGYFDSISRDLTLNGYTVKWMDSFHEDYFDEAHLFIIPDGLDLYNGYQIDVIMDFIAAGGGVVLLGDHSIFGYATDQIGSLLGLQRNSTTSNWLVESDDFVLYDSVIGYSAFEGNILPHPITEGINELYLDRSTAFHSIGDAFPLVVTDNDGTCTWNADGTPANNLTVFAAVQHILGRVVYLTDYNFLDGISDPDTDGIPDYREFDNFQFTLNMLQWLTKADQSPTFVDVLAPSVGASLYGDVLIRWNASDPDRDPLSYSIDYSINDGADWIPIDVVYHGTMYSWDTTTVADGLTYLIRVTASDGRDEVYDIMDDYFIVDNNGPSIQNVDHGGSVALPGAPVSISADIVDISGVMEVYCSYSTDGGMTWDDVTMVLQSGDSYECQIGDFANDTHVEYRIHALDDSVFNHESVTGIMSFDVFELITTTTSTITDTTGTTSTTTDITSTTTDITSTTTDTTSPPPGDYTTIIIIIVAAGGAMVIIIIIIIMKKKSS
ncbi:MAG: hypothetical protein RTU30_10605 [Candidatus Thorarchaeota archaeon]